MPDRVVMDIFNMTIHVVLMSNDVIPETQLPDAAGSRTDSLPIEKPEMLFECLNHN